MSFSWRVGPHPPAHRWLWLPLARGAAAVLLTLFGPLRIRGKRNIPREGGLLILANHLADLDPVVAQYACPRPTHFMAKSELFSMPVIGTLLRTFGSFPVKRGEPDRQALKHTAELLKAGEAVVVFPEGQLSETGELQEIKSGVALIARLAAGVPVICLGLNGTQRVVPYGSVVPRPAFRTITAEWGEPRVFSKETPTEEFLVWVREELRRLGRYEEGRST